MFKAVQKKLFVVSIPNGMEFYTKTALGNLRSASFNSQRDGILLPIKRRLRSKMNVSIPNGMEFYIFWAGDRSAVFARFNSQRDEILPSRVSIAFILALFQFPTGWNSTVSGPPGSQV